MPPTVTTKVSSKLVQNTPLLEGNSGQSFCSDEVEKEVKYIGFKVDISTCIGSSESTNNEENRIKIGAGDQSCVPEKDVPSHGPRKQQLGGLIFGAEVEIPLGFDLRIFEGLHCDLSRGKEKRTWNPWITYHQS
ncbi:hypothetical protein Tco_0261946 [Tanacetum coccineum]